MEQLKTQKISAFFSAQRVLIFVGLFLFVALLHAKPVPFIDEYQYLLRLAKEAHPEFLANDWTFAGAGNEHWLFNNLFSPLTNFVSIEVLGWAGRLICWTILPALLLRLGDFWQIRAWQIAAAIVLWLCWWQAPVGSEWMFGGFQAKVVAYICLLAALVGFCREKWTLSAVLLGLTFSFHPSVGLWGALAVGIALMCVRIKPVKLLKVVMLTALFALPGVLPLVGTQVGHATNSTENWQYLVTLQYPTHLDPFKFSRSTVALLYAMLVFNIFAARREGGFALRFLAYFQAATGAAFALGCAFRYFELFEFLRFMPFRLFPLFTTLFFVWSAFLMFSLVESKKHKRLIAAFAAASVLWLNPIGNLYIQLEEHYRYWAKTPDDLHRALVWLAANTPESSLVVQPPTRRDTWYLSNRAQIVSETYPTYERLDEWLERLADLTENAKFADPDFYPEEISRAYDNLSPAQIEKIRRKYGATHLVSHARYSYPVLFETETYKVYRLGVQSENR